MPASSKNSIDNNGKEWNVKTVYRIKRGKKSISETLRYIHDANSKTSHCIGQEKSFRFVFRQPAQNRHSFLNPITAVAASFDRSTRFVYETLHVVHAETTRTMVRVVETIQIVHLWNMIFGNRRTWWFFRVLVSSARCGRNHVVKILAKRVRICRLTHLVVQMNCLDLLFLERFSAFYPNEKKDKIKKYFFNT